MLTAELLAKWRADPVAFAGDLVMRRPDGTLGPPQLSARQQTWLRALAHHGDGKPTNRTVAVVGKKRAGKTLASAVALLWKSLGEDRRSVCLANSRESAQTLGFDVACELLSRGPLEGTATIHRGRIYFPSLNTEILAVPCSARAVAGIGIRGGLLVSDELWAADDPEPWRLLSSQTEGVEAQVFMVSQASGTDSDVYRLYQAAQVGTPGLWFDYLGPEDGTDSPNPYMTAEFLAERRAALPAALFEQYFLGSWGAAGNLLLSPDLVAGCDEAYTFPRSPEEWAAFRDRFAGGGKLRVAGGLDRALPFAGRDESAWVWVAACPGDAGTVYRVVGLDVMVTGAEAEVEGAYRRALSVFGEVAATAEVYQAADLAARHGWELVHATSQAQVALFSRLSRLVTEGRMKWPEGPAADKLRHQVGRFTVDTSSALPKFTGGSGKAVDDVVFALAHGLSGADVPEPTVPFWADKAYIESLKGAG